MADFLGMMKQAAQLQSKMKAMQDELDHVEVEGVSGGGLVTVRMTAKMDVKAVKIDPSLIKVDEREILEDLLVSAHNDARRKAEAAMQEKMQALTGGLAAAGAGSRSETTDGLRCRSRDRTSDPVACAAAGAWSALGAAGGVASDQEARGADDAAGGRASGCDRQDPDLQDLRQYRHAESLHGVHRHAARSLHHRRGCGCGRPLGAGARQRYQRIYHVLGATLSPLDGVGPQDLTIDALVSRAHDPRVTEIILALNATVDGQTTAHYITDMLGDANVKVTRLAHGVPVGGELDYLDEGTLSAAMRQRTLF